jgi:hypothetical protein
LIFRYIYKLTFVFNLLIITSYKPGLKTKVKRKILVESPLFATQRGEGGEFMK